MFKILFNLKKPTSRSERGSLDPERVNMLKSAMKVKYNYPVEKADRIWNSACHTINNKSRGLRYRFRIITENLRLRISTNTVETNE